MAFDKTEMEIIAYGKQAGKTRADVEQALKNYRLGVVPGEEAPQAQNSTAKDLAIGAVKGVAGIIPDSVEALNMAGNAAIAAVDSSRTYSEVTGEQRTALDELGISPTLDVIDETLEPSNTAQTIGYHGAQLAAPFAKAGAIKAAAGLATGAKATSKAVSSAAAKAKPLIKPENTPEQAIAQIGQGKTGDVGSVRTALATVDTSGVSTFKELGKRIDEKIPQLAKEVDAELSRDTGVYKLKDLAVKGKTAGGKEVQTDYVTRGITNLAELYKTTGDAVSAGNMAELLKKAKTVGLTRKEVNDISRIYGQEFGTKAFSKTGDPLTSVNAQAFENTRKGLKEVARQGLGGAEAKAKDAKLSALYDTQKLIDKNIEAVNKLQQRIQERGLVEKAGYYIAKYADILTGGSIRGFVGGILPRGAGYKVMNALDIEDALRANLDIVEKALKEGSDDAMLRVLQNSKQLPQ